METIAELAGINVGLLPSIFITLFGILLFNFGEVWVSKKVKKFSDFDIVLWWAQNQISFVFSFIIVWIVFYASWVKGTLTVEHCFLLGFTGHLILSKVLKFFYK
jgi:hypothetical protein